MSFLFLRFISIFEISHKTKAPLSTPNGIFFTVRFLNPSLELIYLSVQINFLHFFTIKSVQCEVFYNFSFYFYGDRKTAPPERPPSKIFPPGLGLSVGLRVRLGGNLPGAIFLVPFLKCLWISPIFIYKFSQIFTNFFSYLFIPI